MLSDGAASCDSTRRHNRHSSAPARLWERAKCGAWRSGLMECGKCKFGAFFARCGLAATKILGSRTTFRPSGPSECMEEGEVPLSSPTS